MFLLWQIPMVARDLARKSSGEIDTAEEIKVLFGP